MVEWPWWNKDEIINVSWQPVAPVHCASNSSIEMMGKSKKSWKYGLNISLCIDLSWFINRLIFDFSSLPYNLCVWSSIIWLSFSFMFLMWFGCCEYIFVALVRGIFSNVCVYDLMATFGKSFSWNSHHLPCRWSINEQIFT